MIFICGGITFMNERNSNVLSALSYFSVLFAPFIFPIAVWILCERPTSTHAKKALGNHILAWLFYFIFKCSYMFSKEVYQKGFDNPSIISNWSLGVALIFIILAIIVFIINIFRGIVLLKKS